MSLNGQDHFHRKSVKRCGFHEADKLPLARSPLRRSRAPSIARCPTRHARARRTGPATVLPALPPRSRLPAPRSPHPGLRRDKARPAAGSRVHHPGPGRPDAACRLLQSPRFSSTTTEPDPLTLHAPQRVTPLRGAAAGSLALARERRPSCLEIQGPAWSYEHASAPPYDDSPESFAPNRSARTPHVAENVPAPSRRSRTRRSGTMSPRFRRRTAHKAPSVPGLTFRSLPRRRSRTAHPRCLSVQWTARRPARYPQVVTSLWIGHTTPFTPPRAPFGVDVPSGLRRVDCP